MRRLPAFLLAASAVLSAGPGAASAAAASPVRILQDDRLLIYSGPQVRAAVLDRARALGVGVIRTNMTWRVVESSRGAYDWSRWDALAIEARARGLRILATLTGPAPAWAAGTTARVFTGSRDPDVRGFERFVAAAGRRYSGRARAAARPADLPRALAACLPVPPLPPCEPPPEGDEQPPPPGGEQSPPPVPGEGTPAVPVPPETRIPRIAMWSIWNEPNHPMFLSPQHRGGRPWSPKAYRDLYRAAHAALRRTGHARDTILIGETLPIGSNDPRRSTSTTSPLRFARELFCMNGRGRGHPGCDGRFQRLPATGWAIHAYYRNSGPYSPPPTADDLTPATLGRLQRLLVRAGRLGRVTPGMEIWDTENGAQTHPPDPRGTSPFRQARYINQAEHIAWRTPYLRSYSQYLLQDEQPVWAFQTGLHWGDGRPKPAFWAYRLPIAVSRAGAGVTVWGRIPPGGSRIVTIDASRARDVTVRVRDPRGYFTRRIDGRSALRSRFVLRHAGAASRSARPGG